MDLAGEITEAAIDLALDGSKAGLGSLESLLRGVGGRDADLGQAGGVLAELSNRIVMELFELAPFLENQLLETVDALGGVLFQARAGLVPLGQVCLESGDRARVAFRGERPAPDNVGAFFRQQREALLCRGRVSGRYVLETIRRRRERRQPLFEIGNARIHTGTVCAHDTKLLRNICTSPSVLR